MIKATSNLFLFHKPQALWECM